MNKHERLALAVATIGLASLFISILPGGFCWATDILQGLGTGLVSGVAVLFITGTKSGEIEKKEEEIRCLNVYKEEISELYNMKIEIETHKENTPFLPPDYLVARFVWFFDHYSENNVMFNKAASDEIKKWQSDSKKDYCQTALKLLGDYEKVKTREDLLQYVKRANDMQNDFCEMVFDTDIDMVIDNCIMSTKREKQHIGLSKL